MICFSDMTFCPFYKDCAKAWNCHRPLTEKVEQAAQRAGLPISAFAEKPDCHSDRREK